ncbi:MAG: ASPIC/UnbV domain-containing protein, partial [bacterium]
CKRSFCIMYRNDLKSKNNWLKVSVTSPSGTIGGFGSIVRIYEPGKAGLIEYLLGMHAICGNQGYLGQPDPVLHFGLGKEDLVDIQVTFVGGSKITIKNQKVNQTVFIKG